MDGAAKLLAEQIATNLIQHTWWWWLVAAAAWVAVTAIITYLKPYTAKVAELDALQENMQKVLEQLEQTTTLTKRIEKQIDHDDWIAREWKTLRRVKLEEVLGITDGLIYWVSNMLANAKAEELNNSLFKMHSLAILYFPELEPAITQLLDRCLSFHSACGAFTNSQSQPPIKKEELRANAAQLSKEVLAAAGNVRDQAKALFPKIVGIKQPI